jgi:hypothetical protein
MKTTQKKEKEALNLMSMHSVLSPGAKAEMFVIFFVLGNGVLWLGIDKTVVSCV